MVVGGGVVVFNRSKHEHNMITFGWNPETTPRSSNNQRDMSSLELLIVAWTFQNHSANTCQHTKLSNIANTWIVENNGKYMKIHVNTIPVDPKSHRLGP